MLDELKKEQGWVNGFFQQVIRGWMIGDLKRLTENILPIPNSDGNCNFPISLYVFSCIEFLGYLTTEDFDSIKDGPGGYSSRRIITFIENFFPDESKREIEPYKALFVNIFRNGLAHEYFAKSAGISRSVEHLLYKDSTGNLILDADRFASTFEQSTTKLKEKIASDDNLVKRIYERYHENYNKNANFSKNTPISTSTTLIESFATLSRESYTTTQPMDFNVNFNNKDSNK